ncbi:glycosyltransferase family 2 protein [Microbacterium sp. NPDC056234]|uniref:glycosyltransferase family 2 protein n=1 Tax=Microbacterium sp. NPDC056234 TaxID=3345757 RepID=UPI0035DFABF9
MTPTQTWPSVLIVVPTYRRTALLAPLIAEILAQCAGSEAPTRVVVIDNDPERSAEEEAARSGVGYLHEATPGIAAVRQHALDAAASDELLIMIDDDVVPEPGWLDALVGTWSDTHAAVVVGYVRYVWPDGTDPWIRAGGFMRRDHPPTGTVLQSISTGNVLFDVAQVRDLGVRFDVSLGLMGGEDLLFGRELRAQGGLIVAAAKSVARDDVPVERTTRPFVRRRTISQGQARVLLLTRGGSLPRRIVGRAVHLAGGVARFLLFGTAALVARALSDLPRNATLRRRTWFAQGRILGAIGRITPEYARDGAETS